MRRKVLFFNIIAIFATILFASCAKDNLEPATEKPIETTISIITDNNVSVGSRTVIDGTDPEDYKISWLDEGEILHVYQSTANTGAEGSHVIHNLTSNYTLDPATGKATFDVTFSTPPSTSASYTYGAIYPNTAWIETSNNDMLNVKFKLNKTQNPTTTSFDRDCDILIAEPTTTANLETSLNLRFARIIAVAKMNLNGFPGGGKDDEFVKSVKFTATGKILAGRNKINLATGEIIDWGYFEPEQTIELNYKDNTIKANAPFDAWFTSIPTTISPKDQIIIEVVTTRGKYTRTFNIPADKTIELKKADIAKFSINMETAIFVETVVDNSLFNVSFGKFTKNTTYIPTLDLGVTGVATSALEYEFATDKDQLRANANAISGYEGESGGSFWWSPKADAFTIKNITTADKVNFALSFATGSTQYTTTYQASISKDGGVTFFDLSPNEITTVKKKEGPELLNTMNFHLDAAVTENIQIKIANTGSNGCVVDDVKLVALDAAGAESHLINWVGVPKLTTTPANNGKLTFSANGGAAGSAPTTQNIDYSFENADEIRVVNNAAHVQVSPPSATEIKGVLVVELLENTDATQSRESQVVIELIKDEVVVATSTITIFQEKITTAGETVYTEIKSTDDIVAGAEYIIAATNKESTAAWSTYLPNTVTSEAPISLPIEIIDGKITTITDDMIWTFVESGTGFNIISKANAAIGVQTIKHNNGLRVNTAGASEVWIINYDATKFYQWSMNNTAQNKFICIYEPDNWRTYGNVTTNQNGVIRIFKKS